MNNKQAGAAKAAEPFHTMKELLFYSEDSWLKPPEQRRPATSEALQSVMKLSENQRTLSPLFLLGKKMDVFLLFLFLPFLRSPSITSNVHRNSVTGLIFTY